MKKSLVLSLALAASVAACGTAFAAANPFADVPSKHWAYGAVSQLAKDGIVDGYNDKTFQGDKTMTRYEMAQVVGKAVARADKASAADKKLIDKLSAEFAGELNSLGLRVAALEKNQSNFKISGTMDVRATSKNFTDDTGASDGVSQDWRIRLNATAKVDANTTFNARFVNNSPAQNNASTETGFPQNKTWTAFGNNGGNGTNASMSVDRAWLAAKLGAVNTNLGRQALVVGNTGAIVDSGAISFDGLNFSTKLGAIDTKLSVGRLTGTTNLAGSSNNQNDVKALELGTKLGKLSTAVGYFGIDNKKMPSDDQEMLKLYYANAKYQFNSKFSVNTELGKNHADYAEDNASFYTVWATYGAQNLAKAKDQNIQFRFYSVGNSALAVDGRFGGLNSIGEGVYFGANAADWASDKVTATQVYYNYAFSNNLTGQLGYYVGKSADYKAGDYRMVRGVITAKF